MKKKTTKFNIMEIFKNILNNMNTNYIDVIRGDNPSFFTRSRKVSPMLIFLQMFFNTAKSHKNELENFYCSISLPKDVTTWGFIKQRLKFNPSALLVIIQDFLKSFYEDSGKTIKLLGYYVMAIDGSDFTVPTTLENKKHFGEHKGMEGIHSAMAKASAIYDCLSKMIIDIQINTYKYAEVKLAEYNLDAMRNVLGQNKKKIIIFDRAYACLKLIFNIIDHNEKFLFRLNSTHFKNEQNSMKSNDEWIDIKLDRARINQYRTDFYFFERLLKLKVVFKKITDITLLRNNRFL